VIYNKLTGDDLKFAKKNDVFTEFTKRNLAQRGKPPVTELERKAGNRSHGFSSRRHAENPVPIIVGLDGQYKTKGRVKSKKDGGKLANRSECKGVDPLQEKLKWKRERKARKKAARRQSVRSKISS